VALSPRLRVRCSHDDAAQRRAAAGRGVRQPGRRAVACGHQLRRRRHAARRGGAAAVRGAPAMVAPSARPTRQLPRNAPAHPERSAGTRRRRMYVSQPHMLAQRSKMRVVSGLRARQPVLHVTPAQGHSSQPLPGAQRGLSGARVRAGCERGRVHGGRAQRARDLQPAARGAHQDRGRLQSALHRSNRRAGAARLLTSAAGLREVGAVREPRACGRAPCTARPVRLPDVTPMWYQSRGGGLQTRPAWHGAAASAFSRPAQHESAASATTLLRRHRMPLA